jgi:midasin
MNPGGDYGKKELSPALANRFTSVWVPGIEDDTELRAILERHLHTDDVRERCAGRLMDFWRCLALPHSHSQLILRSCPIEDIHVEEYQYSIHI